MAERLLGPAVELHVFDTSPAALNPFTKAGAIAHTSPRSVADSATIVFASLPNQSVSKKVAFGEDGVASGTAIKIYVEMSTIGTECIRTIANELAKAAIIAVDAPISGWPPAAKVGELAMMVSGERPAVASV